MQSVDLQSSVMIDSPYYFPFPTTERLGVCQQALRRLSPSAVQAQDLTLDPIGSDQLADFVQSNSNFF